MVYYQALENHETMQIVARRRGPGGAAGASCMVGIVTKISWPGGEGRPEYRDGRPPVLPAQQAQAGHENLVLEARAGAHIPIPARGPPSLRLRCVAARGAGA